jgi:hypothetical protein
MDLIIHLPPTPRGHDAIVVFVDRLSKMVHLVACTTDCTARALANTFVQEVFRLHGVPRSLVSDRDSRFTSSFWKEVCSLLGVQQAMSTAFHPQTDGQTERVNRVLEEVLRSFVNPAQDDWDAYLPMVEFAINNAQHESTGASPFFLNHGQHPLTPVTAAMPSRVPAAEAFAQDMRAALRRARECLHAAQQRQKHYADAKRSDLVLAVGDEVMLRTSNISLKTTGTAKLLPRWIGPFQVLERVGELAYKLDLPASLKRVHPVFHVSLLKPYHSEGRRQPLPPPPVLQDEEGPLFEIDTVLTHRQVKRGRARTPRTEYLISWKGFGPEHNSWEPEVHLTQAALDAYWGPDAAPRPPGAL